MGCQLSKIKARVGEESDGGNERGGVLTFFNYLLLVKECGIWNSYFDALSVDIILKYKEKSDT